MNLLEHQAKQLLAHSDVPVPRSWLAVANKAVPSGINYPVVAKSQVPVGGRGKAGGIVTVESEDELQTALNKLFDLDIKGHKPRSILLEEKLGSKRELYLSLRLNRDTRSVQWLVSASGGVEVEENADLVQVVNLDEGQTKLPDILGADPEMLQPLLEKLRSAFFENDLLLLEINPLIEQADGSLVCADAKISVDDNARFRHPDMNWPAEKGNLPKPLGGNIGCIANGAGMAMSTMDTIVAMGGKPANFLDIGGGTGEKEFVSALEHIKELPGVTCVIINIFAGITRCDEIARGIIAANSQIAILPPLFIRLEGTNRDKAVQLLENANVPIEPDLKTCIQNALELRP